MRRRRCWRNGAGIVEGILDVVVTVLVVKMMVGEARDGRENEHKKLKIKMHDVVDQITELTCCMVVSISGTGGDALVVLFVTL